MKLPFFGLLFLLLSACGGAKMPDDNTQNAVARIIAGATVIDVRTPVEIAGGALPDALTIVHTDIVAGSLPWHCLAMRLSYFTAGVVIARVSLLQRCKPRATPKSLMAAAMYNYPRRLSRL